jgi:hypothetical protein
MNCNEARELIEAMDDHDAAEDRLLRSHLAECEDCAQIVAQTRDLLARAGALPRSIEPPTDLWDGIRGRIEAPRAEDKKLISVDFSARSTAPAWRRWGLVAVAAMLLVLISSGMTAWIVRSTPTAPDPAAPAGSGAMSIAWQEFETAESEYQKVTDDLLQSLDTRRNQLAPETVQIVEDNLRLIDEAITGARAALERDPSNAALATRLTDIYRRRVGFLQEMSRL